MTRKRITKSAKPKRDAQIRNVFKRIDMTRNKTINQTNQDCINAAEKQIKEKGFKINRRLLYGCSHNEILQSLKECDVVYITNVPKTVKAVTEILNPLMQTKAIGELGQTGLDIMSNEMTIRLWLQKE